MIGRRRLHVARNDNNSSWLAVPNRELPSSYRCVYIGGPGYALASSIAAPSVTLLKSALDLREASAEPAIAYLSTLKEFTAERDDQREAAVIRRFGEPMIASARGVQTQGIASKTRRCLLPARNRRGPFDDVEPVEGAGGGSCHLVADKHMRQETELVARQRYGSPVGHGINADDLTSRQGRKSGLDRQRQYVHTDCTLWCRYSFDSGAQQSAIVTSTKSRHLICRGTIIRWFRSEWFLYARKTPLRLFEAGTMR